MNPANKAGITPCTCAGMEPFTSQISPESLKKAPQVAFSRNIPGKPSEVVNHISGVRDNHLKNAQASMIGIGLAQQKIDSLPEPIKTQTPIQNMSHELATSQENLSTQAAQVYTLNSQLKNVEDQQTFALAQKEKIEFGIKQSDLSLSAKEVKSQAQQMKRYQDLQKDLSDLNLKHAELSSQYHDASQKLNQLSSSTNKQLDVYIGQLANYKQQALSMQGFQDSFGKTKLPEASPISSFDTETLTKSLSDLANQPTFITLLQSGMPEMPLIPATPHAPEIPSMPAIPSFSVPKKINGIDYVVVPSGLVATPNMPQMPAFPGMKAMPAQPEFLLDNSACAKKSDSEILSKAQQNSRTSVNLSDIAKYFPESSKGSLGANSQSALAKTASGFKVQSLDAIPAIPKRPELSPLPETLDLPSWAGKHVPTPPSLLANSSKFSPEQFNQYSAFWINVQGKFAASQRSADALKEAQGSLHEKLTKLADIQKKATEQKVSFQQYLAQSTGKSPIFESLKQQQPPEFLKSYSQAPATPLECKKSCVSAGIRNVFPNLESSEQVKTAEFFASPDLVSTPGTKVISSGENSSGYVDAHIENLTAKVQAAGGKVASLQRQDLQAALQNAESMIALENKLSESSLVTISHVENLSPQESALLADISKSMSSNIPVIITTPSIGNLSTDPEVNTAMIEKIAPGGSAVDARSESETEKPSVYDMQQDKNDNPFKKFFI